jgi:hypothetical protein
VKLAVRAIVSSLALTLVACGATPPPAPPRRPAPKRQVLLPDPPKDDAAEIDREVRARLETAVEITDPWRWTNLGTQYVAPPAVVAPDGSVDVVVHFHGALVADNEWRTSGINAVLVSLTLEGLGVDRYRMPFATPDRFGAVIDDAVKRVGGQRVRRLALVSWSAGYGATQTVLANAYYYSKVDTVVLLDGMHADYVEGIPDEGDIAIFERFARDAVDGDKQMIVTHSSVVPPNYASTTETATMLLASCGVSRVEETRTNARGMTEWYHADAGGLHVRGYRGMGPSDHMDQVHLIGDVVREFLVPRWTRMAVVDERHPKREG